MKGRTGGTGPGAGGEDASAAAAGVVVVWFCESSVLLPPGSNRGSLTVRLDCPSFVELKVPLCIVVNLTVSLD